MTIHIIITMVLLLAFLIGSIWYAKKKYQINLAVLGLGAVAFFDLAPSLVQVGWLTNPVLVEVVLALELALVAYGTKAIFCKKS